MVAVWIETYDPSAHRVKTLDGPHTMTGSVGKVIDLDEYREGRVRTSAVSLETLPAPAGLYDQELSDTAANEMQQILLHRIGQPTRPASDLPEGDLTLLLRQRQ